MNIRVMDKLGRVVIPAEIREKLDLTGGDNMEMTIKGNKIILKKEEKFSYICHECNEAININDNFCRYCGKEVE